MSVQYCQSNSCGNKFGLFKKKTKCFYCEQYFCRSCIKTVNRRVPSVTLASLFSSAPPLGSPITYKAVNVATCPKCMIMSAPGVSAAQIMTIDTRLLKLFLLGRRIPIDGCTEKNEIVQLVVDYNRGLYPWTAPRASESNTTSNETANTTRNSTSNATRGVDINAATSSTNMRGSRSRSTLDLSSNNAATSQEATAARSLNSDEHLSSNSSSQPNQPSNQENEQHQEETAPSTTTTTNTRRASLSDLTSIEDIESLTIRDIKVILTKNFVNYKGCVEKDELKDRLRRLYKSNKELEERQQQMNNPDAENTATTTTTTTTPTENKDEKKDNDTDKDEEKPVASISKESGNRSNKDEDLCKICMDRLIDCLLLECGHMCSCVKCGKLLNECPICRQYVVRVVRAFKS